MISLRPFTPTLIFALLLLSLPDISWAKLVRYELRATQESVNISGKKEVSFALKLNGSIPAPTLEFVEGDEAEIKVINNIEDQELSIHWHGILLEPEMDGVPYVTTPPIMPGEEYTFKFKLRQHGTYWYHSHTNVQEQKGLYGAFVIHPKEKVIPSDKEYVVVVSDWSDEDARQILKNLRKDGDYYQFKKDTVRSLWGALKAGELSSYLANEWTRMGGMDLSDVGYDAFLINGQKTPPPFMAHVGERVRIRIINAAASSFFHVALADLPMEIVALDGVDIEPVLANEFLIGMAETYDLMFQLPEHKNYELRITAQDGTGSVSTWIGMGPKVYAPKKMAPPLYGSMNHNLHANHEGQQATQTPEDQVDHSHMHHPMPTPALQTSKVTRPVVAAFDVTHAKAKDPTHFKAALKRHDFKLVLDGDMERYVWHINGKAIHEERNILIQPNEVVRFTFVNETMMHHPMHLHGHFFRVLNQFGEYSPLKHTVDVPPHETRVIEFLSDEPGEWMLHCHNLYHLKTGMARVVKYTSYTPKPEIQKFQENDPHNSDHFYYGGSLLGATHAAKGQVRAMNTWNEFELTAEFQEEDGGKWEGEGELFYKRWFGKWLTLELGAEREDNETSPLVGFGYTLPLLIETHLYTNHEGEIKFEVEKRLQWTSRFYSDIEFTFEQNHALQYDLSLMYQQDWSWSVGLMLNEHKIGAGLMLQF